MTTDRFGDAPLNDQMVREIAQVLRTGEQMQTHLKQDLVGSRVALLRPQRTPSFSPFCRRYHALRSPHQHTSTPRVPAPATPRT